MPEKAAESTAVRHDPGLPKPRFLWLGLFQAAIIALVVLMARETRQFSRAATVGGSARRALGRRGGARGRGVAAGGSPRSSPWSGALLLMLPVAWTYVATRLRRHLDPSVVTTIILLPIAVAAILVIVQDSLAVAFSLAGIAGLVRFRNALDDTRDAMFVVIAIAIGLGAGVGTLEASAALSGLYNLAVVALWKWNISEPVIADIALGEQAVPKGQTVLQALRPAKDGERHPNPVAEWYEPGETLPLGPGAHVPPPPPPKREGILRVHAADDIPTRRAIEGLLDSHTKRWTLESDDPGPDGLPTLTYSIRLKKRIGSEELLESSRGDWARSSPSTPPSSRRTAGQGPAREGLLAVLSALLSLTATSVSGRGTAALRSRRGPPA